MDLMPDNIDATAVAERIRPLAQQASEGLRHTSEGLRHTSENLRQSFEQAREALADRIDLDAPAISLEAPTAVALAARNLPFLRKEPVRRGPSALQWLLLGLAVAGAAVVGAMVVNMILQRRAARRRRSSLPAVAPRSAVAPQSEPVAIPVAPSQEDRSGDAQSEAGTAGMAEAGMSEGSSGASEDESVLAAVEAAAAEAKRANEERSDNLG